MNDDKQKNILDFLDDETTKDVVEVVKEDKRKLGKNLLPQMEKGDNTKYLQHVLACNSLPKVDLSNPKEIEERVYSYFKICKDDDMKPTLVGLANSLGCSRQTLWNIANENTRKNTKQTEIIQRVYSMLEQLWEMWMTNGKINPVSGIFLGKNNFGYKDQQEVVVTPNNPLGESSDPDDIKRKYLENNNDILDADDIES